MAPTWFERMVGRAKKPEEQKQKQPSATGTTEERRERQIPSVEVDRRSEKWCNRRAERLNAHYLDSGKGWRKLVEMGDPKAGMGGRREDVLGENAFHIFALDYVDRWGESMGFVRHAGETGEMAKETGIPQADLDLLFQKSEEHFEKYYGKKKED